MGDTTPAPTPSRHTTYTEPYTARASHPNTPHLTSYLLRLMHHKKSNLCLSADVQSTSALLDLASECGPYIVLLKTHADIITDFSHHTIKKLIEISKRHKFLLFEDRKFGDIGNTVQTQYAGGLHRIATWAQFTNAHIFPGPAIVSALKSAAFSALAAGDSCIETSISGGGGVSEELGTYLQEQKQKRRSLVALRRGSSAAVKEEEGEESSSSDDTVGEHVEDNDNDKGNDRAQAPQNPPPKTNPTRHSTHHLHLSNTDPLRRKSSIVSVSTTISSSAEYISPPTTSQGTSFPHSIFESSGPKSPLPVSADDLPPNPPYARGLFLLAQMSSKDNMLGPAYTQACVQQAQAHRDFVVGFIAQESLNTAPEDNFLVLTPGVNLPPASDAAGSDANEQSHRADALGQQYNTPRHAILEKGVDVIIVGRGILNANDRRAEARRYQKEGWAAYEERLRS